MSGPSKEVHDWLLAHKPDGASHDMMTCPFCTEKASQLEDNVADEKLLSQEQHDTLLKAAVEKASHEVTAERDAEIIALNEKLASAEATITEKDEVIQSFKDADAAREEAKRLDALAVERVDQVKEVANFSDEQIASRKAAWAKMSVEDFDSLLEDFKAVSTAAKGSSEKPPKTNFDGTRETAGTKGTEKWAVSELFTTDAFVQAGK
jgi:hypothetical protein